MVSRVTVMKLLTRPQFKEAVFARDNHTCVLCDLPANDAHHILDRQLWNDGGYYLDNGVSVCAEHHLACERTDVSIETLLKAANIKTRLAPLHMYVDQSYDKWGNCILSNGQRTKGELFYNENVQKIIKDHLHKFTDFVKYPRSYHLPWSVGVTNDDRIVNTLTHFEGQRVVVTEKLDGENTSLYKDGIHARSVESKYHASRDWVKSFWAKFAYDIPASHRICGENMFALHSIKYDSLLSYFYGFSMWHEQICMSWDDTQEWFELLGIQSVPVLYDGVWDEKLIKGLWNDSMTTEGYVVRVADSFHSKDFKTKLAKFVRKDHVQTSDHWMQAAIKQNGLK